MGIYVGIDVSKKTLDIAWLEDGKRIHFKTSNTTVGFEEITQRCPHKAHFVMEATGAYYLRFAFFLAKESCAVSVINPLTIKRFGQLKLRRAKTDKADAFLIAEYGMSLLPELWSPPKKAILEMQQLWSLAGKLTSQKLMLTNQLEAFSKSPAISSIVCGSIKNLVQSIKDEMGAIEDALTKLARDNYSREIEILESIPGIGRKSAQAMLIVSKGFKNFDNGRELCSFIGLTPRIAQSGTSLNSNKKITKMGQSKMRALLYMCALTAITKNAGCKQLYDRFVTRGKPKKVALIAVMAKLVRQAVTLIKQDELFNEKLSLSPCFS